MTRKYRSIYSSLILIFFMLLTNVQAAQIEVAGKHVRSDGSIYDFEVVDGDALSPGDRFQIIINTEKTTYYAILYFSREGKAAQIFPPAGKTGRIQAGERQYVPGLDNYFTLDINGGRELMFVVTSPTGISNLRAVLRDAESLAASPTELHTYLQKRLPQVKKLEITNTGKSIVATTDQVSSSLVRDITATYEANPWSENAVTEDYGTARTRQGNDNSIPEAVRRRTAEVRSLLKRTGGTGDSSSLRTVQHSSSLSTAPATGEIRREDRLMEQQEKQAHRQHQQTLAEEERQRQEAIKEATLARQAAEAEAKRLQQEREAAERLEAQRLAEAEAQSRELEAKRKAMAEAEAETKRQAELQARKEQALAEQKRLEEELLATIHAEEMEKRRLEEQAKAERLLAERLALEKARQEAQRLAREKAATAKIKAAEAEAVRLQAEAERRALDEARRQQERRLVAEKIKRQEAQRVAQQAAAEEARKLEEQRLAAELAAQLEAERKALAEAEAEAKRRQREIALAEQQRQEKARAEAEARQLVEQHAASEAERQVEEARRQAELIAEEESLHAEQQAFAEKFRQQQLAEDQGAASDNKGDKGIFGQIMAFVSGDAAEKPADQISEQPVEDRVVIVEAGDAEEVMLNKSDNVSTEQAEFDNSAAAAPREAVVVLQAPERPVEKKLSAPAPVRIIMEDDQSVNPKGETAEEMVAQVASAIVSIRTSNDQQASGFMLDTKGHILTGWHVINGVSDIDVNFMAISGAPRAYKAKVVKYDKFHDLALLKLIDPPEGIQPITVSSAGLPDAGSTVRVFGQKDGQVWATDNAVITRIAPHFTWFSRDNVIHRGEVLQVDLPPEGKDIGSLVTTMDYQMLGVKSFSGSQTGRTYAVSVGMIRNFIESRGVVADGAKPQ